MLSVFDPLWERAISAAHFLGLAARAPFWDFVQNGMSGYVDVLGNPMSAIEIGRGLLGLTTLTEHISDREISPHRSR